ncbi:MAG TPA: hypothetical protein VK610_02775 [Rhodothermales bacterium]|nr:hypothetical protein [Rhodothermales bacterium]
MRRPLAVRAAALALLFSLPIALTACDGDDPIDPLTQLTFDGITYNVLGGATLTQGSGSFTVGGIGASGNDGVRVTVPDGAIDALDVSVEPVALDAGDRWGMQAYGATPTGGTPTALASAWSDGLGGGRHQINIAFASGLGITHVMFRYFLGDALVLESPPVDFIPGDGLTGQQMLVQTAGQGGGDPRSVHTTRSGGTVEVGTDYRDQARPAGSSGDCTGILITTPFFAEPICADYVVATPLNLGGVPLTFPTIANAEIKGRGIDAFTVTANDGQ